MNCYNGENYLKNAIHSAISQSYVNWELIFFNNASTDSSKEIFFSFQDERLKYFERSTTIDIAFARNEALLNAEGDWIAILDVDDVWDPNKLEFQLKALSDDDLKDAKIIFTNCEVIIENKVVNINQKFSQKKVFEDLLSLELSVPWSSVLINKDTFTLLNGFDTKYPSAHDLDFLIRCAKEHNFLFVDRNLVSVNHHDKSLSSLNKNSKGDYYFEIIDVLAPHLANNAAILGTAKMKVSHLFLLLKMMELRSFFKAFHNVSFRELLYFPLIFLKKFFKTN
jgi:glycosyltransferase involved in cell wall biosynthesis